MNAHSGQADSSRDERTLCSQLPFHASPPSKREQNLEAQLSQHWGWLVPPASPTGAQSSIFSRCWGKDSVQCLCLGEWGVVKAEGVGPTALSS